MYIICALLLLNVLVIAHEGGHFWAARLCGIEVEEYAVGMGPLLFQRVTKRNTKISLRLFPIGGYCMFYDEDTDGDSELSFNRKPAWKRLITVLSGPGMNFLVAFLAIVIYLSAFGLNSTVNRVAAVEPNAAQAGLLVCDTITAVNGQKTSSAADISSAIMQSEGEAITLTVDRKGEEQTLSISPFFDSELDRWRGGLTSGQERVRLSLLKSIPFSVSYNMESATVIVDTLRGLITRGDGVDEVTGPVGTVYVISEVTKEGGIDIVFELLALISVNLGIMNLLPIPGLDGSRILFLLVEMIRRKPINRELEGRIHMIGFALLMALMFLLTYKDILRISTGFFGR